MADANSNSTKIRLTATCKNLIGQTFDQLTVAEFDGRDKIGNIRWKCLCTCGTYVVRTASQLRSPKYRKSCGCVAKILASKASTRHGMWNSPEYIAWAQMIQRCHNSRSNSFSNYGARGISVCDKWRESFIDFLADVGIRPTKNHSIDRYPDNDGNYEPGNVRWATRRQQQRNTRYSKRVIYNGKPSCITDLAERAGVNRSLVYSRLKQGWTIDRALSK